MTERFDAAYYARFYGRRPVHTRRQIASLGQGVMSFASWWRIPIRSVLDVGAGKGYWRDWLAESHPTVKYHGIDASEYACRRYRHERADIAVWRPSRQYDLVVCQSTVAVPRRCGRDDGDRHVWRTACRGVAAVRTSDHLGSRQCDRPGRAPTSTCTGVPVPGIASGWLSASPRSARALWLSRNIHAPFFELERVR